MSFRVNNPIMSSPFPTPYKEVAIEIDGDTFVLPMISCTIENRVDSEPYIIGDGYNPHYSNGRSAIITIQYIDMSDYKQKEMVITISEKQRP